MIKTKRKAIYICAVAAGLIILSGCTNKKKDIEYVDDSVVASNSDAEEIFTGDKLRDKLGIGDEKEWRDKVGKSIVAANIDVPDVNFMYTQKFEEYYYTNKDKKLFMERAFDKDSQRVDTMSMDYPCRESIEEKISFYEGYAKDKKENDDPDSLKDVEYFNELIDSLNGQLGAAPKRDEVSTSVGDYSANQYRATINGIEYSVKFEIDPASNVSNIRVVPIDYSPFNSSNDNQTPFEVGSVKDAKSLNVSEKGYDELKDEAERFLVGLDITGFVVTDEAMLEYYVANSGDVDGVDDHEYNGYAFMFTRQIAEVDVGCDFVYEGAYSYTKNRPYITERIIVRINDTGLVGFEYMGILKPVSEPVAVKLLPYEDVKSVVMKELGDSNLSSYDVTYYRLRLGYERVTSTDLPDTFCYVPAWKLDTNQLDGELVDSFEKDYIIMVNAIDGSVISDNERPMDGTIEDYYFDIFFNKNYR